nr:hypothetical protein CFP56_01016 [Quercus suber]
MDSDAKACIYCSLATDVDRGPIVRICAVRRRPDDNSAHSKRTERRAIEPGQGRTWARTRWRNRGEIPTLPRHVRVRDERVKRGPLYDHFAPARRATFTLQKYALRGQGSMLGGPLQSWRTWELYCRSAASSKLRTEVSGCP